ncbi:MAG: CHC2 zinc finger domain-containing protein [Chloroflexota bacterium]|nr:CHC2 zinc finger domain-containing protein [Chloroflexota bacterium]
MLLSKEEIKERIDIGKLVESDLGPPVRESGDWQLYFCPFHPNSRTPALGVNVETGTFKCFSCQEQGDIFTWRMLREGEDFKQALAWFRQELGDNGHSQRFRKKKSRLTRNQPPRPSRQDEPPSVKWQQRGHQFLDYAQDQLWRGDEGLQYGLDELFGRGLNAETIVTWGLGFNPTWQSDHPEKWGLTPKDDDDKIWLARGLVIPCQIDETLWYLKVRVFGKAGKPVRGDTNYGKYNQPKGGKGALFGAGHLQRKPGLLLAESELDMLLAWQEGRDFLDVASLGGAGKRLNERWIPHLLAYRAIYLAYDRDKAGRDGAQKLSMLSQRLLPWPPPMGDLCDFHRSGGDLREMMAKMHDNIIPAKCQ